MTLKNLLILAQKRILENKTEIKILARIYAETDTMHKNKRNIILSEILPYKKENKELQTIIDKKNILEKSIAKKQKELKNIGLELLSILETKNK